MISDRKAAQTSEPLSCDYTISCAVPDGTATGIGSVGNRDFMDVLPTFDDARRPTTDDERRRRPTFYRRLRLLWPYGPLDCRNSCFWANVVLPTPAAVVALRAIGAEQPATPNNQQPPEQPINSPNFPTPSGPACGCRRGCGVRRGKCPAMCPDSAARW